MKILKFLTVERLNRTPSSLWGDDVEARVFRNLRRLVVLATDCEGFPNSVIVYGIDPDRVDPSRDKPVFEKWMLRAQLDGFLAQLPKGDPAELAAGSLQTMDVSAMGTSTTQLDDQDSVDYPVPRPPTTGPKLQGIFTSVQTLIATSSVERRA